MNRPTSEDPPQPDGSGADEATIIQPLDRRPRVRARPNPPATSDPEADELTHIAPGGAHGLGGPWTPGSGRRPDAGAAGAAPWTRSPSVGWEPPVERFQPPPPDAERPRRRVRPTRAVVWLLCVVLAGIGAGWLWTTTLRPVQRDARTSVAAAPGSSSRPVGRQDATQVVRDYLDALARGDVSAALQLGDAGAGDRSLLTSTFATMVKTYPITDIHVGPQQSDTTVAASYRLGAKAVNATFAVASMPDLSWRLVHSAESVRFQPPGRTALPLQINQQRVEPNHPYALVPGIYQPNTGLPFLQYDSDDTVEIDGLDDSGSLDRPLTVNLTGSGRAAMVQATRDAVAACAQSHDAAPHNCPFAAAARPGYRLTNNTWTVTNLPADTARSIGLNPTDPSSGQLDITVLASLLTHPVDHAGTVSTSHLDVGGSYRVTMSLLGSASSDLSPTFAQIPG